MRIALFSSFFLADKFIFFNFFLLSFKSDFLRFFKIFPSAPKMGKDGQTSPSVPKLGTDGHPGTKVTTGHQTGPKMGQNSIISTLFARRAKKAAADGLSSLQELEVGLRSGPYLLVIKEVPLKIIIVAFAFALAILTFLTALGLLIF